MPAGNGLYIGEYTRVYQASWKRSRRQKVSIIKADQSSKIRAAKGHVESHDQIYTGFSNHVGLIKELPQPQQ